MLKRLGTFTWLVVAAVLLAACAPGPSPTPAQSSPTMPPAQPVSTAAEAVVTLVSKPNPTQPAPEPVSPTVIIQAAGGQGQETAASNLRALLNAPDLRLTYKGQGNSGNAPDQPALLFEDTFGNSYYVNQTTLQPLEFTLVQPIKDSLGEPKSPEELRAIAEQFATLHSRNFLSLRSRLKYSEGNKGGENNFFRWYLENSDVGGGMPVTLQIGLKKDGSLFAFLNSLDFLS